MQSVEATGCGSGTEKRGGRARQLTRHQPPSFPQLLLRPATRGRATPRATLNPLRSPPSRPDLLSSWSRGGKYSVDTTHATSDTMGLPVGIPKHGALSNALFTPSKLTRTCEDLARTRGETADDERRDQERSDRGGAFEHSPAAIGAWPQWHAIASSPRLDRTCPATRDFSTIPLLECVGARKRGRWCASDLDVIGVRGQAP